MVTRGDILWLGIASGVTGGLIGGGMLGVGMDLAVNGQPLGLILGLHRRPVLGADRLAAGPAAGAAAHRSGLGSSSRAAPAAGAPAPGR